MISMMFPSLGLGWMRAETEGLRLWMSLLRMKTHFCRWNDRGFVVPASLGLGEER